MAEKDDYLVEPKTPTPFDILRTPGFPGDDSFGRGPGSCRPVLTERESKLPAPAPHSTAVLWIDQRQSTLSTSSPLIRRTDSTVRVPLPTAPTASASVPSVLTRTRACT